MKDENCFPGSHALRENYIFRCVLSVSIGTRMCTVAVVRSHADLGTVDNHYPLTTFNLSSMVWKIVSGSAMRPAPIAPQLR